MFRCSAIIYGRANHNKPSNGKYRQFDGACSGPLMASLALDKVIIQLWDDLQSERSRWLLQQGKRDAAQDLAVEQRQSFYLPQSSCWTYCRLSVATTKSTALLSRSHTSFFHSVGAASVRLDCDKYFINRSIGFNSFYLHDIQCIRMLSRYCIRFTVDINYGRWIQKFFTQWRLFHFKQVNKIHKFIILANISYCVKHISLIGHSFCGSVTV